MSDNPKCDVATSKLQIVFEHYRASSIGQKFNSLYEQFLPKYEEYKKGTLSFTGKLKLKGHAEELIDVVQTDFVAHIEKGSKILNHEEKAQVKEFVEQINIDNLAVVSKQIFSPQQKSALTQIPKINIMNGTSYREPQENEPQNKTSTKPSL